MEQRAKRSRWIWRGMITLGVLMVVAGVLVTCVPMGGPPSVEFHAGRIEAHNTYTTTSYTSSERHARLNASRMAVINFSDHQLMRKVGRLVAERLRALPNVHTVDYFAAGTHPAAGHRLYDLYITLEMPAFKTSGWILTGRTIDATITATAGQNLFNSHHLYFDTHTPPILRIGYHLKLEHHSTTTGFESASATYKLAARNIAQQIGGALSEKLREAAREHGTLPALPAGFYGDYHKVPSDLPLPGDPGLERVLSGSGLMLENHTAWKLTTHVPRTVLADLKRRLKEAGWRITSARLGPDAFSYYLRALDEGEQVCVAFEVRERGPLHRGKPKPTQLAIRYLDQMTRSDVAPVLDRMLTEDDTPMATLVTLEALMTHELRGRLMERMRADPPTTAEGMLTFARLLHVRERDDEAMARLAEAYRMARHTDPDMIARIKGLAERITGVEDWNPTLSDDETSHHAGAHTQHATENAS